tara:strand:- start:488 stop:601 length:114 start_codon:yes stop_codon:yes gene_type:complete
MRMKFTPIGDITYKSIFRHDSHAWKINGVTRPLPAYQ